VLISISLLENPEPTHVYQGLRLLQDEGITKALFISCSHHSRNSLVFAILSCMSGSSYSLVRVAAVSVLDILVNALEFLPAEAASDGDAIWNARHALTLGNMYNSAKRKNDSTSLGSFEVNGSDSIIVQLFEHTVKHLAVLLAPSPPEEHESELEADGTHNTTQLSVEEVERCVDHLSLILQKNADILKPHHELVSALVIETLKRKDVEEGTQACLLHFLERNLGRTIEPSSEWVRSVTTVLLESGNEAVAASAAAINHNLSQMELSGKRKRAVAKLKVLMRSIGMFKNAPEPESEPESEETHHVQKKLSATHRAVAKKTRGKSHIRHMSRGLSSGSLISELDGVDTRRRKGSRLQAGPKHRRGESGPRQPLRLSMGSNIGSRDGDSSDDGESDSDYGSSDSDDSGSEFGSQASSRAGDARRAHSSLPSTASDNLSQLLEVVRRPGSYARLEGEAGAGALTLFSSSVCSFPDVDSVLMFLPLAGSSYSVTLSVITPEFAGVPLSASTTPLPYRKRPLTGKEWYLSQVAGGTGLPTGAIPCASISTPHIPKGFTLAASQNAKSIQSVYETMRVLSGLDATQLSIARETKQEPKLLESFRCALIESFDRIVCSVALPCLMPSSVVGQIEETVAKTDTSNRTSLQLSAEAGEKFAHSLRRQVNARSGDRTLIEGEFLDRLSKYGSFLTLVQRLTAHTRHRRSSVLNSGRDSLLGADTAGDSFGVGKGGPVEVLKAGNEGERMGDSLASSPHASYPHDVLSALRRWVAPIMLCLSEVERQRKSQRGDAASIDTPPKDEHTQEGGDLFPLLYSHGFFVSRSFVDLLGATPFLTSSSNVNNPSNEEIIAFARKAVDILSGAKSEELYAILDDESSFGRITGVYTSVSQLCAAIVRECLELGPVSILSVCEDLLHLCEAGLLHPSFLSVVRQVQLARSDREMDVAMVYLSETLGRPMSEADISNLALYRWELLHSSLLSFAHRLFSIASHVKTCLSPAITVLDCLDKAAISLDEKHTPFSVDRLRDVSAESPPASFCKGVKEWMDQAEMKRGSDEFEQCHKSLLEIYSSGNLHGDSSVFSPLVTLTRLVASSQLPAGPAFWSLSLFRAVHSCVKEVSILSCSVIDPSSFPLALPSTALESKNRAAGLFKVAHAVLEELVANHTVPPPSPRSESVISGRASAAQMNKNDDDDEKVPVSDPTILNTFRFAQTCLLEVCGALQKQVRDISTSLATAEGTAGLMSTDAASQPESLADVSKNEGVRTAIWELERAVSDFVEPVRLLPLSVDAMVERISIAFQVGRVEDLLVATRSLNLELQRMSPQPLSQRQVSNLICSYAQTALGSVIKAQTAFDTLFTGESLSGPVPIVSWMGTDTVLSALFEAVSSGRLSYKMTTKVNALLRSSCYGSGKLLQTLSAVQSVLRVSPVLRDITSALHVEGAFHINALEHYFETSTRFAYLELETANEVREQGSSEALEDTEGDEKGIDKIEGVETTWTAESETRGDGKKWRELTEFVVSELQNYILMYSDFFTEPTVKFAHDLTVIRRNSVVKAGEVKSASSGRSSSGLTHMLEEVNFVMNAERDVNARRGLSKLTDSDVCIVRRKASHAEFRWMVESLVVIMKHTGVDRPSCVLRSLLWNGEPEVFPIIRLSDCANVSSSSLDLSDIIGAPHLLKTHVSMDVARTLLLHGRIGVAQPLCSLDVQTISEVERAVSMHSESLVVQRALEIESVLTKKISDAHRIFLQTVPKAAIEATLPECFLEHGRLHLEVKHISGDL